MKRIVYSPLVEQVRGSLTGAQALRYAREYNKAWYSPKGEKNAARNYHANYIGKVSARTNEPYLVIRKRSSVKMSEAMIRQMAAQGGCAAVYNSLLASNQAATARILYQHFHDEGSIPSDWSFRRYWWQDLFAMIKQGSSYVSTRWGAYEVRCENPWRKLDGVITTPVSDDIRLKFWTVLGAPGCKVLEVNDRGIKLQMMYDGESIWEDVLQQNYNTLGFSVDVNENVRLGDYYINCYLNGVEKTMSAYMYPRAGMFTSEDFKE